MAASGVSVWGGVSAGWRRRGRGGGREGEEKLSHIDVLTLMLEVANYLEQAIACTSCRTCRMYPEQSIADRASKLSAILFTRQPCKSLRSAAYCCTI